MLSHDIARIYGWLYVFLITFLGAPAARLAWAGRSEECHSDFREKRGEKMGIVFPVDCDQYIYIWLVVWNINFYDFPYIGDFIIPTDELIFFRGAETTNQTRWLVNFATGHLRNSNSGQVSSSYIHNYSHIFHDVFYFVNICGTWGEDHTSLHICWDGFTASELAEGGPR